MRILIIGAGKVGSSVAGNLVSESNDITIVDTNKAKIAEIQSNYDLQGIVGGCHFALRSRRCRRRRCRHDHCCYCE